MKYQKGEDVEYTRARLHALQMAIDPCAVGAEWLNPSTREMFLELAHECLKLRERVALLEEVRRTASKILHGDGGLRWMELGDALEAAKEPRWMI